MMAAEADIIRFIFTGEDDEVIPDNTTHVSVHPTVTVIPARLFIDHPNIVELICHDGVIKIESFAFHSCPRLKRVIMNGVEEVETRAFDKCKALEYVECNKLEIIGYVAFCECRSMTNISLPSAKTVRASAFWKCPALVDAKFGHKLESIGGYAFRYCRSLQRITLPLKNGLFDHVNTFQYCKNLRHVDLIDEEVLQLTIDALLCEEWKDDLNTEVESIDQILPNATAGARAGGVHSDGEKAIVLRRWINNVLRKIIKYKAEHRRLLKEAESRLQLFLPHDIVMNSVVPFLILPQHTFDGEEEIFDSNDDNGNIEEKYSSTVESSGEEDDHDDSKGGTAIAVEEGKQEQEGVNNEARRKRQRTESNGTTYLDGEEHD